jgi:DNA (cytosine-5)-methyltransferase 1
MKKIPIISLFCGCGGLDLGFSREGFETVLAIDINKSAVKTYNFNHGGHTAKVGDLTKLDGKQIYKIIEASHPGICPRGIISGPPCQTFSQSNVYVKQDDIRCALPRRFAQLLGELNQYYHLDFFVFENVRGITFNRHKKEFSGFRLLFEKAGFRLFEGLLDAQYFGVPQKRPRVFVVGINSHKYHNAKYHLPLTRKDHFITVAEAIQGLPEPKYFQRHLKPGDIPLHPNHWTMNPKSRKFYDGSLVEGKNGGRSFRVLAWNKPSWTVAYGNREIHIHPSGKRRLSIYEAMLLQGFPKKYQLFGTLSDQVRQVSDAVPPPLAAALARSLRHFLKNNISSPCEMMAISLTEKNKIKLQKLLLDWFKHNGRNFPWRSQASPYFVLVAEKLLQQTAVNDKLIEVYSRLTNNYSTPGLLSNADISTLENIIRPLGLRYRAKELQQMANELMIVYNNEVPRDLTKLMKLTGVGEYASRAVLSLAFNEDIPVVDTNIARFLYRMFGLKGNLPSNPARKRSLVELASELIPEGRSKDFNLAVLDLCALICKVNQPKCLECPVQTYCAYNLKIGSRK